MSGNLVAVCALFLMASEANISLRLLVAHLVDGRMYGVAAVAGHLISLMLAAIPVGAGGTFMAGQALIRTRFVIGQGVSALLEDNIRCGASLDGRIALQMFFALTVTGLAIRCA